MRAKGWRRTWLVLAAMAFPITALAFNARLTQQGPQTSNGQGQTGNYTISDNVDLVLLDAAVNDPKGGYVTGLKKSAFQVYEDGHPRPITQFASVDTPV